MHSVLVEGARALAFRPRARWLRGWTATLALLVVAAWVVGCTTPNYLLDADPVNADLTIHVVIENPAGTHEKWEVRADGRLVREHRQGRPIEIPYLPWPVNGGMIPRTLLSAELGGDGEPLDVLVLGPARPRGSLVRAVPIGLLQVIDRLERDDKILAVVPGHPMGDLTDVAALEERYPGVREILAKWFAHSRRNAAIEVQGYGTRAAARRLIAEGAEAFDRAERSGSLPTWDTPE